MKKLPFLTILWLCAAMGAPAAGQALDTAAVNMHEARFHVYDYQTRKAIGGAAVCDASGKQLGETDLQGHLALKLPAIATQPYTIKAKGYDAMSIRLTHAAKSASDYDVFLPKADADGKVTGKTPESAGESNSELVKVYVRQDPDQIRNANPEPGQTVEFAVQLSATSKPITDKNSLKSWQEIGPVFIHNENGLYKVRIGPYTTQEGAKEVLLKVKARGKKDAFIVVQKGIENHIPFDPETHYDNNREDAMPVHKTAPVSPPASVIPELNSDDSVVEYKVRLVSYLKPGGFNTKDVDQYGPLESYRKGEWTILMIGGFSTEAEADRVREKVIAKGFKDASVVTVRDGLLQLEH